MDFPSSTASGSQQRTETTTRTVDHVRRPINQARGLHPVTTTTSTDGTYAEPQSTSVKGCAGTLGMVTPTR